MFRMQCMGTKKDGGRCGSMVNHNGWNLDDAGSIYCHNHRHQGNFRSPEEKDNMELQMKELDVFMKKLFIGAAILFLVIIFSTPIIGRDWSCGLLFIGFFAVIFLMVRETVSFGK